MQAALEANLAAELGVTKTEADRIFNAVIRAFHKSLAEDPELRLRKFGTFKVKQIAPRRYHNPQTGEIGMSTGSTGVTFRPSKATIDAVTK